jgi:cytoskeleton protein RodZ
VEPERPSTAAAPPPSPAASEAARPSAEPPAPDAPAVSSEPEAPAAQNVGGADSPRALEAAAVTNERATPVVAIPLEFTFDAESWAEVTDARGERLLFGLNAAGRRVTLRGEPPFAVVLGNAAAVRLVVDGAPFEIPMPGRAGDPARFSVDIAEE